MSMCPGAGGDRGERCPRQYWSGNVRRRREGRFAVAWRTFAARDAPEFYQLALSVLHKRDTGRVNILHIPNSPCIVRIDTLDALPATSLAGRLAVAFDLAPFALIASASTH